MYSSQNKIFECICFLDDELWTSGIEVEEGIREIPDTWIRGHTHQIVIYTAVVTLNPIQPLPAVAAGWTAFFFLVKNTDENVPLQMMDCSKSLLDREFRSATIRVCLEGLELNAKF